MPLENLAACILCDSPRLGFPDRDFNVCRCGECGLVFENPRPDSGSIFEFYSRPVQYDGWLREASGRDRLWRRRLAKMRPHLRPGSLLDIGTGIGQFLDLARRELERVAGTEVSASAVAIARERYGLDVRQGEAETMDFGGERFDNITLFHVLEHVGSPRRMLAKCRELLKPQGVLFLAVPNDIASAGAIKRRLAARTSGGSSRASAVTGLPRLTLDGTMDEIHLSHFTPGVLERRLPAEGFELLECSLDPAYVAEGPKELVHGTLYRGFSALRRTTGINLYGTIWACARRL